FLFIMVIKLIKEMFFSFMNFWKEKIFKISIFVQISYLLVAIILFLLFFTEKNDFIIFYQSARIFLTDINNLYDQTKYLWDFRYFPLSTMFFLPFTFLDFNTAFIYFSVFSFFINILIILIMERILIVLNPNIHNRDKKRIIKYFSFYLMGVPNILNYIYGQINLIITFFMLLSLLILISREKYLLQFLGSIILGISIIIKPTSILLIPFLISVKIARTKPKFKFELTKTVIRFIGVIFPLSLNIILFLIYPKLWEGFLATNITGTNPVALNFSFSLTKIIINLLWVHNIPFNQLVVLVTIALIFIIIGFIFYIIRRLNQNSLIYGFLLGMLIMLISYYDSWDHHLLNITPLLIIIILYLPKKENLKNLFQRSFYFFNFFDLAFVGLWYLTYPLFPYNFIPTVFLIITFYGTCKLLVVKIQNYEIEVNQ
ncbi:MAG: glycosyltransferase 87 family protein, partial [Promethearchaeota archaeon]